MRNEYGFSEIENRRTRNQQCDAVVRHCIKKYLRGSYLEVKIGMVM
jgi:hypothetical protein